MNLDELLASLNSAAQADLAAVPLLDAADYIAAIPRTGEVAALAPHVYVECFGLWLFAHDAFGPQRMQEITTAGGASLSPAKFSRNAMAGRLMTDEIAEGYRDFAQRYARDLAVYATDYVETLVTPEMLRNMFDVRDLVENGQAINRVIDERYRRYALTQTDWAAIAPTVAPYELTLAERTETGWLASLASATSLHDAPEAKRREALARFWALVDFAPEIASPAVITALIRTFKQGADSSVMQSALNALKDMDFAAVLSAVLADAIRLQQDGEWLGSLLGLWGGVIADEYLPEFQRQISNVRDDSARRALRSAIDEGLLQREPWAINADMAMRL